MPMLYVQTNVPVDQLPAKVNQELTQQVSDLLGKPKSYIFVSVTHTPNLTFQGESQLALLFLRATPSV